MTKEEYKIAWRITRLMDWGTLHFRYTKFMANHMRDAYNNRNATMYTARDFYRYGYYQQGLKRL